MLSFLFRGARRPACKTWAAARRSFVPRLDVLEDRTVPSTLTVTTLNDSGAAADGSLRGQIAAAAPGDTINFAPQLSGTLALGSDLTLDRNLTILGNLDTVGNPLVTLSRGKADWSTDLIVNAGVTASVSGLAFTGGSDHALLNSGSLTLDDVAVSGNQIGYDGAVAQFHGTVYNSGTLIVQNSRIANNSVDTLDPGGGGGIWNDGGTLTVANSTLASNEVSGNGANGGGIWSNGGTATITGSTITANTAWGGCGGGIGGYGSWTISGCTLSGNSASVGGGLWGYNNGPSTLSGCTVSDNSAQYGGGIYLSVGNGWTLASSTVAHNQATAGQGGGIYLAQRITVTVSNSTIAGSIGGGIYVSSGSPLFAGGTLTLLDSTVAGNQTAGAGGGLWVGTTRASVSLTNTLLAGNTAPTAPDVSGPLLASSAFNLIGNGDGSSGLVNGTLGNQVGTTAAPINPLLGPLQNNGGPTATIALESGSPVIDAGSSTNPPAYDQRGNGFARVVGAGIDIGAFEAQPAGVMTHFGITAPASAVAGTPFAIAFQALDDFGNPAPGYAGPVHLTVTDGQAVLTRDYTLTGADAGAHAFSVVLTTVGTQVFTVTAGTPGSPLTQQGSLTVSPAAAASLRLSAPAATTAGQAVSVVVTLLDAYGNVATGYTGTVRFTSSDAKAVLPANYTFTGADAGTHTFSVTLKTAGTRSITAADTRTGSLTATTAGIVVNPAAAAKFVLTAPASVTHGVAFSLTLTVQDAYGNVVTGYTGAVHFTSSDGTAILPANYTFTAADAGVHTFVNGAILRKKGTQTLTVTDLATSALTATDSISVT
jgi:hypothetical protein